MKQEDETSIVAQQVSKEIHKCPDHRITEDNFVLGYLPLFMEMAKNPDGDYKSRPDYQTWLRNTVNGIREVEVVDNVNQDEVLFTVPPINSITTDFSKTKDIGFSHLLKEAEQRNHYIPGSGDTFLKRNVIQPLQEAIGASENTHMDTWRKIFARYSGKTYHLHDTRLIVPPAFTVNKETFKEPEVTPSKKTYKESTDDLW